MTVEQHEIQRICRDYHLKVVAGANPSISDFVRCNPGVCSDTLERELALVESRLWTQEETPQNINAGTVDDATVHEAFGCMPIPPSDDRVYESGDMIGRYRIESLVGTGGFANVYRAIDTTLERIVAIKVPRAEALQAGIAVSRYVEEARNLARLQHEHIVSVHDVVTQSGLVMIVMEFVDGITLRERIGQGPIPFDEALSILEQVGGAIEFAHSHSLIHRDLNPRNILLDKNGRAWVTDFGLAVDFKDGSSRSTEYAGTRGYMSPEQRNGDETWVNGKSDVWALSVTAYEMLAGKPPELPQPCPPSQIPLHLRGGDSDESARSVHAVGVELDAFCLKGLSADPEIRHDTAAEFLAGLQAARHADAMHRSAHGVSVGSLKVPLIGFGLVVVALITFCVALSSSSVPTERASSIDRTCAEMVIRSGGTVELLAINHSDFQQTEFSKIDEIPEFPFVIDWLMLTDVGEGNDQILKDLTGLQHVTGVDLCRSSFTDRGLIALETMPKLRSGLFYGCRKLTDKGIARLLSRKMFYDLILSETEVGAEAFKAMARQTQLRELRLINTRIDDDMLPTICRFQELTTLRLDGAAITDQGIQHLAGLEHLEVLGISGTSVSDRSLPHLYGLHQLRLLDLCHTRVTSNGVEKLQAAIPNLQVTR